MPDAEIRYSDASQLSLLAAQFLSHIAQRAPAFFPHGAATDGPVDEIEVDVGEGRAFAEGVVDSLFRSGVAGVVMQFSGKVDVCARCRSVCIGFGTLVREERGDGGAACLFVLVPFC